MNSIVCFGQRDNGKDETSDYLALKFKDWKRCSFAEPIKNIFCDMFNVDKKFIEDWKRKDEIPPGFKINVRQGLQEIGEGARKIKENVWYEKCLRQDQIIVSDGRYLDEADSAFSKQAFNILIYRPGYLNYDTHKSESELRPFVEYASRNFKNGLFEKPYECRWHYFLVNDGTLDDLHDKIENDLFPHILKHFNIDNL